jgi:hypothetical protein
MISNRLQEHMILSQNFPEHRHLCKIESYLDRSQNPPDYFKSKMPSQVQESTKQTNTFIPRDHLESETFPLPKKRYPFK